MFLNKSGDNFIMGASGISAEGSTWIEVYSNTTHYVRFGSSSSAYQSGNASANMNVWRTYKIEKGKFYVDGVQKLTPNYASMPSRSLVIYGRNSSTPNGGVVKIRSAKILRDGAPILDLSSVRIGSTGSMYDRVSGQLFGNNGTGDFIVGADV
jgi:NADPH-dependent curcumin reductase CurA